MKFVTKEKIVDITTSMECRWGPSRDGIAVMVLHDAMNKSKSLEKIKLLTVQDAMVVLTQVTTYARLGAQTDSPEEPSLASSRGAQNN